MIEVQVLSVMCDKDLRRVKAQMKGVFAEGN